MLVQKTRRLLGRLKFRLKRLPLQARYRLSHLRGGRPPQAPLWSMPAGLQVGELQHSGVRYLDNFATPAETDRLIELGRDLVQRSTVIGPEGKSTVHDYRTSSDTFIRLEQADPAIAQIVHRAAVFLGLPPDHAERFSITRYQHDEYYKSHMDHDGSLQADRLYTVLLYLNSLAEGEGGDTVFERLNLRARPVRGRALCWVNSLADKTVREETLHSALPVLKPGAEKWVAQMWFRAYKVAPVAALPAAGEFPAGRPLDPGLGLPDGIAPFSAAPVD